LRAADAQERDEAAEALVGAVVKEIEPLLEDGTGPFFGGSERLTIAEVCICTPNSLGYTWDVL
jgi:glutathione S-transferase